ncbi:MAG TPA: hypothetical protein VIH35_08870 [Kiritimatiellia bacterium]|jgi:hypothetical protein
MKFFHICTAAFAACLPITASAAIETVVIALNAETQVIANIQSYVVPTNKILVIENVYPSDPQQDLIVEHTSTSVRVDIRMSKLEHVDDSGSTVDQSGGLMLSFQPSLKIPGGWSLRLHEDTFGDEITITIFGLLVDADDLYAGIPNEVGGFARSGGSLQTTVALDAGRQAIVKLEESDDLQAWIERTDIATTFGASHSELVLTTPLDPGTQQIFHRALLRSRRGSAGMPH